MSKVEKNGNYYYIINMKKTRISKKIYDEYKKNENIYDIKKMKGGNINDFFKMFNSDKNKDNIIEIGRGAAGIVYLDKTQQNSVFKISKRSNTCRLWNNEKKIYDILQTFDIDTSLCKILKMKDYLFTDDICSIELTRAFNPKNIDTYTIHPQFQCDILNYVNNERGHFLGIKNLIKDGIFTSESIEKYIKNLGIIMARLHYKAKNDGYDLELFVSKIKNNDPIIYIADFDLSEFYEDKPNQQQIERLAWSLEAYPYFPIKGSLYEIFSNNYMEEAEKYDMKNIATEVLRLYTEFI
jgi:hypothetical protein